MTKLNIESIQDKLFRLKSNTDFIEDILKSSDDELLKRSDFSKYTALEHLLQLSIQIILDIGSHILAEDFHENPATYNEVIIALGEKGIITKEFAKQHEEMAKFRNKLVHDYGNIDQVKVLEYGRFAPEVFRIFGKAFVDYIQKNNVIPSQKGFVIPLIIAIMAVLAIGGGVYVYENNKTEKSAVVDTGTQQTNQNQQQTNTKTLPVTTQQNTSANNTNINNISTCDLKNNSDEKNRCYEEVAIKNVDVNVCSKITTSSTFDHCVVGVAGTAKNISLCTKVKSDNTRNICYGSVAYHTLNISYCDLAISKHPYPSNDGVKELCYANIARELKDVSICEKIKIPTEWDDELGPRPSDFQGGRVYCYQQVAKSLKDKNICEKIISKTEKNKCVSGI
ncbi:MAG: DUF86 domain-containing protein [bacterium]|nr:DUF86 domain-containing protein [bacterium]